jgi:hypothetical protein
MGMLIANADEPSVRIFFGRFLMVHLAQGFHMDGYLGFTSPETLALYHGYS